MLLELLIRLPRVFLFVNILEDIHGKGIYVMRVYQQ